MRSKTLALLLVAVIASGIVFAVSAQSQITAADIAKAILPGGFINPKGIMPGAITHEHLASDAVRSDRIPNGGISESSDFASGVVTAEAIDVGAVGESEIAPYAIPRINYTKIGNTSFTGTSNPDAINTSGTDYVLTTTQDNKGLIIMYSARCTSAPGRINVTVKVLDGNTGEWKYTATPEKATLADDTNMNTHNTLIFFVPTVAAGTYGINVTVESSVSGAVGLYNQTLIAYAI